MGKHLGKLETLRGGAASYVILHHLDQAFPFKYNAFNYFFRFGQEAVILFFIISGFVIIYSTPPKISFKQYFIKRFRRIYPLFIAALVLGYLVECIHFRKFFTPDFQNLLGNLINFQDFKSGKPGVWISPFAGNLPLWSLSYEWWFYMFFFPIYKFIPVGFQKYIVLVISIIGWASYIVFPNQISLFLLYFIIWWGGVELCRTYLKDGVHSFRNTFVIWISLFIICILLMSQLFYYPFSELKFGLHPVLEIRHFTSALIIIIIALLWSKIGFKGFKFLNIFKPIAPISFALYIFHYPVLIKLQVDFIESIIIQKIILLILLILFSILMEVNFQKIINTFTNKLINKGLPYEPGS
jgi:peptidoglycan/LPS O-acetylase OafA/YrhL